MVVRLKMTASKMSSDLPAKTAATKLTTKAKKMNMAAVQSATSCGVGELFEATSSQTTYRIQKQNQQKTIQTTSDSEQQQQQQQQKQHLQLQRNLLIGLILTAFCAQVSRKNPQIHSQVKTILNMSMN